MKILINKDNRNYHQQNKHKNHLKLIFLRNNCEKE
jgi:hypothetical protein